MRLSLYPPSSRFITGVVFLIQTASLIHRVRLLSSLSMTLAPSQTSKRRSILNEILSSNDALEASTVRPRSPSPPRSYHLPAEVAAARLGSQLTSVDSNRQGEVAVAGETDEVRVRVRRCGTPVPVIDRRQGRDGGNPGPDGATDADGRR
ncbi:Hypp2409 [Branchiostoma lanceolatum]|uniref:Hypp2409 protein n=1 Tax=Branchiostoma lanceolatum TaxID=7740 RepID=A0A8K0EPN6_BRALA|nr:Hypp2409 [Branchiostoma lanceolatum]